MYALFVEILGFGVFTFLIGTVASRLMRKDPATVRYRENIDSLAALMHYRTLPENLRDRIVNFYKYMWKKRIGYDETAFLHSLPNNLRTEVALLLKPIFLTPGDYIFKAGDFFGEIALFKNQNRSATIKALSYCDIYALDKSSFDKVISRYPEIGKQIRETVELRERKYSV